MQSSARRPVVQVVASSRGGGAVHVRELAAGLAARGQAVVVVMPLDGGPVGPEDFRVGSVGFVAWGNTPPSSVRAVTALARIWRAQVPALVHAHGSRAAVAAHWGLRLAGRRDTPLVLSVHGLATPFHRLPRRLVQLAMERWVCRRAAAVIAVSHAERAQLLGVRLAAPTELVTVPHGLDLDAFAALGAPDRAVARHCLGVANDARLVVAVCRLDRPRDFPTLLRAFRAVVGKSAQARLLIAGDGPMRAEIESLIAALDLRREVRLLGWQKDVAAVYAAADVCALTSSGWEAFGLSAVEAQAAGVPVVVTDVGGAREVLRPGESGFLVPACEPAELGDAILRVVEDPQLQAAMGRAGREFALTQFAREPMVERMMQVYERATQSAARCAERS